ncbi:TonB-dependent receptor [Roseiterribacter gracilis]|uniref:TonB-dependent receptor n=1 Tax=Roseiterribacter gracilis TaxID=2812848 RepID=A0A8S8XFL2_9PROT|nr:TonB-dependent receptor [Rhodospirillales bacterium TMPK1]
MGHSVSTARSARSPEKVRAHRNLLIASSTALYLCLAIGVVPSQRAYAQTEVTNFNVPAQPLRSALLAYSAQSKVQVAIPDELVEGKNAPAVTGALSNEQALQTLLGGSGVSYEFVSPRAARLIGLQRQSLLSQRPRLAENTSMRASPSLPLTANTPEELVVTGTRIKGAGPVGSEVVTLNREQISESGRTTTADVIRSIPQNSGLGAAEAARGNFGSAIPNTGYGTGANLRGLGPDATLTLINGRRMAPAGQGSFVDVSQIPVSAIEKIEVVLDGASAIYGSDAVAGVVNLVLRRDFEGLETTGRYALANGFRQITAGQSVGTHWEGGGAFLSYEFFHQTHLAAEKRSYVTDDLRAFGGPDLRVAFGNPGTIAANGTTYAIPSGQNGVGLSVQRLIPGTVNLSDTKRGTDILPDQERHSVVATASHDLTDRIRVYEESFYSRRAFNSRVAEQTGTISVPSTNPFFVSPAAGARTVSIQYAYGNDIGNSVQKGVQENYTITPGVSIDVGGSWRADLYGSYSADIASGVTGNRINTFLLASALADTNPATAFNPFGAGSQTSSATLARILGYTSDTTTTYRVASGNAEVGGDLIELPAGKVKLVSGVEYRKEQFRSESFNYSSTPQPVQTALTEKRRRVTAAYGELLVPLVGEATGTTGLHTLELSIAGRAERYSDFGRSENPKVGMRWRPISDLEFRGSWGTSFKAPFLRQLNESTNLILVTTIPDPRSASGRSSVLFLSGGNAQLKPETAETWSAGFDLRPRFLPGLTLGVTYFSVDYRDRIQSLSTGELGVLLQNPSAFASAVRLSPSASDVQALYGSPQFSPTSTKPPASQIAAIVDGRPLNLSVVQQRGLDVSLAYNFVGLGGDYGVVGGMTYIPTYDVARTPAASATDRSRTIGFPLEISARAGITWRDGNWNAAGFVNYQSGYQNTLVTPAASVDAWTTVDASVAYRTDDDRRWLGGMRFTVGIQNLLNRKPPVVIDTVHSVAYDPEQGSPIGRVVSLTIQKRW